MWARVLRIVSLCLLVFFVVPNLWAAKGPLILLSHPKPPYTLVAEKIKEAFPLSRIYTLEKIQRVGTTYQEPLVVCLGSKALRWAVRRPWQGKVVFSLVLELEPEISQSLLARTGRLYGILLSFPPERYLFWLKNLFPQIKRVGFLATTRTQHWKDDFLLSGRALGFEPYVFYLSERKQLESVLRQIATKVKALLVLPDPLFINYLTFPKLVFFSIEQEIVLISLSERLARAGALISLGWDFPSLASQTIELMRLLASGKEPERRFSHPKKEVVYVNYRILRTLNLKIPANFYGKVVFVGKGDKND